MKDFASSRTVCVAVVAAVSITWGVLVGLFGRPATGPWSVGLIGLLALSVAQWVGFRATRSFAQAIRNGEAEPRPATVPATMGGPAPGLSERR
jgi:hypothetical protein